MNLRIHNNSRKQGFTLIELLVVMGIILLMVTLVLVSVGSMLRSSRMSRAVGLIVAAVDEARTAAVTLRRSTKVDLTQIDPEGRLNRLSVVGPFFNENFESYTLAYDAQGKAIPPAANGPVSLGWTSSGGEPYCDTDGTRCLYMNTGTNYWNVGARVNVGNAEDYESTVQARVKFLRQPGRTAPQTIKVFAAIQDSGATISDAYQMNVTFQPAGAGSAGRNNQSTVSMQKTGAGGSLTPYGAGASQMTVDANGNPSATTDIVEGVWYRVSISVKRITDPNDSNKSSAIVAGKIWVDGQLEPWNWTVGPCEDKSPLPNGPGGVGTDGGPALADDVLFDARPIRLLPEGVRVDALDPTKPPPSQAVMPDSPYYFPILFRPDGTASSRYVIRVTDITSNDRRYVTIDQNTGRARLEFDVVNALSK